MNTLSVRDVSSLLEIVDIGARDSGSEPFPSAVLAALSQAIPSDACVGYQEAEVSGRFRIVEAVEVVPEPGADTDRLADAIRAACADLPAAARPRSLRFVDAVVTTGGKIVRRDT